MNNIITYNKIKDNSSFWIMFLACNFPKGFDETTNIHIPEIMSENYNADMQWVDDFTGYYDGVMDESDGYIGDPKKLKVELSTGNKLYIEFHPGDTIYFIDDDEIGCTGPHYIVRKINWLDFKKYTCSLSYGEKFLMLPMVYTSEEYKEEFCKLVYECLKATKINECDFDIICKCIVRHCMGI